MMEDVDMAADEDKSNGVELQLPPLLDEEDGGGSGDAPAGLGLATQRSNRRRGRPGLSLVPSLSLTNNCTQIVELLFLGGQEACSEPSTLRFLKVDHILNCAGEVSPAYPEEMTVLHLPIKDTNEDDVTQYFHKASEFIATANSKGSAVLVHCMSGMSRSATMVLAHMMIHLGMTLEQALMHTKERRPRVSPNPGFMAQLIELDRKLHGTCRINLDMYKDHRFDDVQSFILTDGMT